MHEGVTYKAPIRILDRKDTYNYFFEIKTRVILATEFLNNLHHAVCSADLVIGINGGTETLSQYLNPLWTQLGQITHIYHSLLTKKQEFVIENLLEVDAIFEKIITDGRVMYRDYIGHYSVVDFKEVWG